MKVCVVGCGAVGSLFAEHVRDVIRVTTFPAGRIVAPGQVSWDTAGDTEVDLLNAAIVTFGERYGVDTPLDRALTTLAKGHEKGRG